MTLARHVTDMLIRRKVALHKTPLDRYQVRIARTVEEYEDAFRLVHAGYVYQGIESVQASEIRMTPQHLLPEATVLVAYEDEQLVGTMTVTLDSPAGLPLDKDYPAELNALRRNGTRLVEYGALAIVERCWHTGVTNLLNIAAYRVANEILRATHTVIGVHPRALPVYRALYNFQRLGAARQHAALRAPVVGVVQDMSRWPAFCASHFRRQMRTGHLPVEHFCGRPLACIELPTTLSREELVQWKMSPGVYQQLATRRSVNDSTDATVISLEARRRRQAANHAAAN